MSKRARKVRRKRSRPRPPAREVFTIIPPPTGFTAYSVDKDDIGEPMPVLALAVDCMREIRTGVLVLRCGMPFWLCVQDVNFDKGIAAEIRRRSKAESLKGPAP